MARWARLASGSSCTVKPEPIAIIAIEEPGQQIKSSAKALAAAHLPVGQRASAVTGQRGHIVTTICNNTIDLVDANIRFNLKVCSFSTLDLLQSQESEQ